MSSDCFCVGDAPINTHDLGDSVRVEGLFKDKVNDIPIDPDVVKLSVRSPDDVITTYQYGADVEIAHPSLGLYWMNIDANQVGRWYYRWFSTGSWQAADEQVFTVRSTMTGSGIPIPPGDGGDVIDPELLAIADLISAANKGIHFTGPGAAATHDLTSFSRDLFANTDLTSWQTALGISPGTFQPLDAELTAISTLPSEADTFPYFTDSGAASLAGLTAFSRTLLAASDAGAWHMLLGISPVRVIQVGVIPYDAPLDIGDGKAYIHVPSTLHGLNISLVHAMVIVAGTTGTTDFQVVRIRGGIEVDVLSTKLTIDSGETGSDTAAVPAVIDAGNRDLQQNDVLRLDVDAVSGNAPLGLVFTLEVS